MKTVSKAAWLSADGRYRYTLHRVWNADQPQLNVIGLNPSTADDKVDDPTIRRCINFAIQYNFGKLGYDKSIRV